MNEFDLIARYFNKAHGLNERSPAVICGVGDDAAVIQLANDGEQALKPALKLVTCCDTLIAGVHFANSTSAFAIGYKAVAVNLSDLAAMSAKPHSILLALSLPPSYKEDAKWLDEFSKGLYHCCAQFGVNLIGGDTTKSDVLSITITALGFADTCTYRSGAQVGDVIAVTGALGDAAFALKDVLAGKSNPLQHRLDMPTPRVGIGHALSGVATSMIDVSDGLLQDLGHICQQSNVGARLDLDTLPTSEPLSKLEHKPKFDYQLSGGDDYELLFTLPKTAKLPSADVPISIIGEVVAGAGVALYHQGALYPYQDSGFQHF